MSDYTLPWRIRLEEAMALPIDIEALTGREPASCGCICVHCHADDHPTSCRCNHD
jgi:hypothetical protein